MAGQDNLKSQPPRPKQRGGSPERDADPGAVGMTNPADQGSWDLPSNPPNDLGPSAPAPSAQPSPAGAADPAPDPDEPEPPAGLTQSDPDAAPEPRPVGGNRSTTGPRRAGSKKAAAPPRRKHRGGTSDA